MEMKLLELDQVWGLYPEPGLNIRTVFPGMGILMLKIIVIMGRMGICFYVGGDLMLRRGMLPIIMLPDGDLRIVLHLVPFFLILTIWRSVHIEETVVGWRNQLRMKTSLRNSRNFISQRSTSHATQSFITPGAPQFPQLFCSCMVQLLAGIISLRRVLKANPGRSHGSADTLPLRHSAK